MITCIFLIPLPLPFNPRCTYSRGGSCWPEPALDLGARRAPAELGGSREWTLGLFICPEIEDDDFNELESGRSEASGVVSSAKSRASLGVVGSRLAPSEGLVGARFDDRLAGTVTSLELVEACDCSEELLAYLGG